MGLEAIVLINGTHTLEHEKYIDATQDYSN